MRKKLIIVAGPTATGKSDCAIRLAKKIGGEIISADSMQVYRGMDIGSAKIKKEEMDGIRHHLIDIMNPSEEFNIVLFQKLAKEAIGDITKRGFIPIIAGGTGFYIQSVLYDIDFTKEETDKEYRHYLEEIAKREGNETLFEMLRKVDPASCEILHANNQKRVIRALEFYHETGTPISLHNMEQHKKESPYLFCYFVLTDQRDLLYERIDQRVDRMIDAGLVEEVKRLYNMGIPRQATSMQGLGYKEIYDHLLGECSLEEAVFKIKRDTRHFAKRQITWFKREPDAIWLDRSQFCDPLTEMSDKMEEIIKEKYKNE